MLPVIHRLMYENTSAVPHEQVQLALSSPSHSLMVPHIQVFVGIQTSLDQSILGSAQPDTHPNQVTSHQE